MSIFYLAALFCVMIFTDADAFLQKETECVWMDLDMCVFYLLDDDDGPRGGRRL